MKLLLTRDVKTVIDLLRLSLDTIKYVPKNNEVRRKREKLLKYLEGEHES